MVTDGPFAGITVLEIGQFVVVPVAMTQFAHAGARVIKIEPTEGDVYRRSSDLMPLESRQFLTKNRGKESVALKIGAPGSEEVLRRLINAADVVATNMSPGALKRHGLDYESVREINPRIVYGSVSAFGHVGPEAKLPGLDVIAQARSGLLFAFGAEDNGAPMHSEVQAADYTTSALLIAGISAALFARERTGEGQKVEVSLLGGGLYLQGNAIGHFPGRDPWREEFVNEVLPQAKKEGRTPTEIARLRAGLRPEMDRSLYRVVRSQDGYVAIAGSPQRRGALLDALGIEDDPSASVAEKYATVDAAFAKQTSQYWVDKLGEVGSPVAAVWHVDELHFDEHAIAEELMVDVEHPTVGTYRALGAPIRYSRAVGKADAPSPRFAVNTRPVLAELGFTDDEIATLAADGVIALGE